MSPSLILLIIVAALLLYFDIILICKLIINKLKSDEKSLLSTREKGFMLDALLDGPQDISRPKTYTTVSYFDVKQSIQFDGLKKSDIESHLNLISLQRRQIRRLRSIFETNRVEAAAYLGLIGTERAREELEKSILKEKSYPAKLYMANALADIANPISIPILVASLVNSHRWYRDRVNMLIADYGESFDSYLPHIIDSDRIEIMELIVDFSGVYFSERSKNYLINIIDKKEETKLRLEALFSTNKVKCCANCVNGTTMGGSGKRVCRYKEIVNPEYKCHRYKVLPVSVNSVPSFLSLVNKAADILAKFYPKLLNDPKYLHAEDSDLKNIAIKALASFGSKETIDNLLQYLRSDDSSRSAINAISKIIERNPESISTIAKAFMSEKDLKVRKRLAEVLSGKIEYFIMKLTSKNRELAVDIIKEILLLGRTSEIIGFLNKNKDIDIENELIAIVKEVLPASAVLEEQLKTYLVNRLAKKCGLTPRVDVPTQKEEKKDKKLTLTLYLLLAVLIMLFPIVYVIRRFDLLFNLPLIEHLKIIVLDFNYYLAYYSIAVNFIYIVLLILSFYQVRKQLRRWKVKNSSLLFKSRMLPSISIIAPAFNEEKTIIESANSLLNLKYPDYELIIVNDGSKDSTLEVLIRYFDLVRVDYRLENKLNTKPIHGIYRNPSMPMLIVVDKANGGKADSLNMGINISTKEYFCGIDADSLLENDALLKLASLTLDQGLETPAMGGNIFPINGCTVERGQIKNIQIPENKLAKLQTIEYIRAFMAGRLGWTSLNSLLIISGAFGLFRKERVIRTGGYLTSSGKYAKDTVGEDMELVVRISRLMRELGQKYSIGYAFNANCWTEVPEDLKSLKRQRYRWHRGLIDILTFHKRMLFNPRYGRTGMLAMPYFFVFEMIGPMLEMQGYLMVLVGLIFGLLNKEIALLLLISTILMGVLVSISSLLIAEKDLKYFKLKDILVLIGYSIIENFGPRQLISLWRVGGYFSMLRTQEGWGKVERKGFTASNTSVKA